MPPDSDATTVAASEGEVQKKLAASKKPQEPETNTSMEADSHRPKLSQRTQSKEFLKEKEQPERSPDPVAGAHVAKSHATAVKAKAQPPVSVRVPPKTEEEATAEAVAQCLQRKSTAELNKAHSFASLGSPQESKDQANEGSDSEDVNSDMESEKYQKKEKLAKAKRAAHARYMRFSRSLVSAWVSSFNISRAGVSLHDRISKAHHNNEYQIVEQSEIKNHLDNVLKSKGVLS